MINRARIQWRNFVCVFAAMVSVSVVMPLSAQQPAGAAGKNAVLEAIPENATAFLAIRNIRELDTNLVAFAQQLGLPVGPEGIWPGLVQFLMEQGFNEGFDTDGSFAAVVLDCRRVESLDQVSRRLALMIPATDPDRLAQSLGGEREGDFYTLQLLGSPSIAATKGKFLVAAQEAETVREILTADGRGVIGSMSPDRLQAFERNHVLGWAALEGVSPQIRKEVLDALTGVMMMGGGDLDAVNELTKFIDAVTEGSFGIKLDVRQGILFSGAVRAKQDSEVGRQMLATPAATAPLLLGLAAEPTVLALGQMLAPDDPSADESIKKVLEMLLSGVMLEDALTPEQRKQIEASLISMMKSTESFSLALTNLPGQDDLGLVGFTKVVKVRNSEATIEEFKRFLDQARQLLIAAARGEGLADDEVEAVTQLIQWKQGVEQVNGATVNHLLIDVAGFPDMDPATMAEIKKIVGREGLLFRVAPVNETQVAVTFGGGAPRLSRVIEHVRKGETPLNDSREIRRVADRLPRENLVAEGYLNVDQLLSMIVGVLNAVGQPLPFPIMLQDAAPLAMTCTRFDGAAQEVHVLIPTELVASAKTVVEQVMMMMMMGGMDGGQPGGPHEPAPPPGGQLQ